MSKEIKRRSMVMALMATIGGSALASTVVDAYSINQYLPKYATTGIMLASDCPSGAQSAISNAIDVWKAKSPTNFKYYLVNSGTTSPYTFEPGDGNSVIGAKLSSSQMNQYFGSTDIIAVCCNTASSSSGGYYLHSETDIAYNTSYSYGSGTSANYYDWQGVFTHELGHAYGLADIYSHSGAISTLPTMYGYSTFGTNMSVYYNLRSLTSDDTNGKAKVADIRGF